MVIARVLRDFILISQHRPNNHLSATRYHLVKQTTWSISKHTNHALIFLELPLFLCWKFCISGHLKVPGRVGHPMSVLGATLVVRGLWALRPTVGFVFLWAPEDKSAGSSFSLLSFLLPTGPVIAFSLAIKNTLKTPPRFYRKSSKNTDFSNAEALTSSAWQKVSACGWACDRWVGVGVCVCVHV